MIKFVTKRMIWILCCLSQWHCPDGGRLCSGVHLIRIYRRTRIDSPELGVLFVNISPAGMWYYSNAQAQTCFRMMGDGNSMCPDWHVCNLTGTERCSPKSPCSPPFPCVTHCQYQIECLAIQYKIAMAMEKAKQLSFRSKSSQGKLSDGKGF